MHIKTIIAIFMTACLALAGCDGSDSAGSTSLQMPAASGAEYALDGTYAADCLDSPTIDSRDFIGIAGSTMVEYEVDYPSVDGTCSGVATEHHRIVSDLTVSGINMTTVGWSYDMVSASAPTANNGSIMGSSFTYNTLVTRVTASTWPSTPDNSLAGDVGAVYFIADDTPGGPAVLYRGACPVDMGEMHDFCMTHPDTTRWVKQ